MKERIEMGSAEPGMTGDRVCTVRIHESGADDLDCPEQCRVKRSVILTEKGGQSLPESFEKVFFVRSVVFSRESCGN